MNIVEYKHVLDVRNDIEPLYVSAFPEEERPPVDIFFDRARREGNKLLAFYEDNKFIGFTDLLYHNNICYIFFLAIAPEYRNQGYGSKILKTVVIENNSTTYFLCFEEIDDSYPDIELRKRRRDFYFRNGFKDNELKTFEYGVRYDSCYYGARKVTFGEYLSLMIHHYGERARKYIFKA